jgi:hypothetical protein
METFQCDVEELRQTFASHRILNGDKTPIRIARENQFAKAVIKTEPPDVP